MVGKIKVVGVSRRVAAAAVATLGIAAAGGAAAQEFPAKGPIRLIVGFAPGGGTDAIARAVNVRMGEVLKQTVIVENRAGAGGAVGADYVARQRRTAIRFSSR